VESAGFRAQWNGVLPAQALDVSAEFGPKAAGFVGFVFNSAGKPGAFVDIVWKPHIRGLTARSGLSVRQFRRRIDAFVRARNGDACESGRLKLIYASKY
jgi:hypothetical protein